jgi:two-component system, chemotaxis family, CheB/CheR fusion protein
MAKKPLRNPRRRRGAARSRKPSEPPSSRRVAEQPASIEPDATVSERPVAGLTVVGIGASAGGLEAFSQLLRSLPANADLVIVFVQHLAPQHDSALPVLLSGQTSMPVIQVSEGLRVETNHVYVIPPNVHMAIDGDQLHLRPRPDDRTQYTPVDSFFTSLAESAGSGAIGVILSGTASDGALGIREIKAAGGITIAQQPETAKYDGMPRAAIATGMVDLVLPPQGIATKLAQIAQHPYIHRAALPTQENGLAVGDEQLQRIFEILRPVSGIDFRHYKLPTIKRRLIRRMALQRITEVDHYIKLMQDTPAEVRNLYQDLLIHVTRFFREPESFKALGTQIFPKLLEGRKDDQPIRAWVSGCATGEEAYSLAICLLEFLQGAHTELRIQIFATDVSEPAIEHARAGVYPATIEADVSPERLRRFFTKSDGSYRVSKTVRDMCVFARQDLTRDPPFSRLDLILCRNVLIYLDAVLQRKLVSVFHYALNPSGFLILGQAETVGTQAGLFSLADKKHRIYRKKITPGLPAAALPVEYSVTGAGHTRRPTPEVTAPDKLLTTEVSRIIFDRYAPPGVVIDSELQIVQFRGQTGDFLEPAPGDASLNVLKMAREGLLYGLRTALNVARKSRQPVRKQGLQVRSGHGWKPFDLEVVPLTSSGRMHFLVLFDSPSHGAERKAKKAEKVTKGSTRDRGSQVDLLQRELAASRDYLQSIIQELEAANEELQSANEEILSSNEELQSTNEELDTAKEELQSTNEELNTVNEELHGRNEELSRVNSDLVNLLASVQIAIVIVGSDLRIRRFTPMAERILNLIPGDMDRPIGHIKPNIDVPELEKLITESIDTVSPIERDVRDSQGRWYALRIRPYKSLDNKIDGAVLALFDVDVSKRSEERVQVAQDYADAILQATDQPITLLDPDLRVQLANGAFCRLFGVAPEAVEGRSLQDIGGDWDLSGLRSVVSGESGGDGRTLSEITLHRKGPGLDHQTLRLNGRLLSTHGAGSGPFLLLAISDGIKSAHTRWS